MSDKKNLPDDMDLFRRKFGDVRALKTNKRVPTQTSRTSRDTHTSEKGSQGDSASNSPAKNKCLVSPQKKSFETMKEAMTAAQYVEREWETPVYPYRCYSCGRFHLSSKKPR